MHATYYLQWLIVYMFTWLRVAEYSGLTGKKGTALRSVTSVLWFWVVSQTGEEEKKKTEAKNKRVFKPQGRLGWNMGSQATSPSTHTYTDMKYSKKKKQTQSLNWIPSPIVHSLGALVLCIAVCILATYLCCFCQKAAATEWKGAEKRKKEKKKAQEKAEEEERETQEFLRHFLTQSLLLPHSLHLAFLSPLLLTLSFKFTPCLLSLWISLLCFPPLLLRIDVNGEIYPIGVFNFF